MVKQFGPELAGVMTGHKSKNMLLKLQTELPVQSPPPGVVPLYNMCVAQRHDVCIIGTFSAPAVYSLTTGAFIRQVGSGHSHHFCLGPHEDTLLVTTADKRFEELNFAGATVRTFGGFDVLKNEFRDGGDIDLACNTHVIVTVETPGLGRTNVFSWADGTLLRRFSGNTWWSGFKRMGSGGFVNAFHDSGLVRLGVLSADGEQFCSDLAYNQGAVDTSSCFRATEFGNTTKYFLVSFVPTPAFASDDVYQVARDSGEAQVLCDVHGVPIGPSTMVPLQDDHGEHTGLVVWSYFDDVLRVYRNLELRMLWIGVCVCVSNKQYKETSCC